MKILRNILIVLLVLVVLGYAAYKIAYPYVAPMIFDYIVEHNADAFLKLEQSLSESIPQEPAEEESPAAEAPKEAETPEETPQPEESAQPKNQPTPTLEQPSKETKSNTEVQTVKTTMGEFSGEHLLRALKNMSPADKTRIISLCQSAVPASEILKTGKMFMQEGLSAGQQKYIENYLRDNLSVPAKREILEILKRY